MKKTITIRLDEYDKKNFELICKQVGVTPSYAINMFIKETLKEGKIPFELKYDPFYSKKNQEVLRKSIDQMEKTSGTIHNIDLDA